MASPGYSPPHSCQYCQKMVLDFSEDENNPYSLSQARWDLARKIADENNLQPKPANSKDSRREKRILRRLRDIVLFDMTLEDLESNAANGCLLCDRLLQEHSKLNRDQKEKFVLAAQAIGDSLRFGSPKIIPHTTNSNSKDANNGKDWDIKLRAFQKTSFQILTLPGNPAANTLRTRPVNINPASENAFSLAHGWLQTCLEEHMSCPEPTGDFMPTRLLEILYIQGSRRLRLRQTKHGEKDRYAALTYCWGLERPFISTKRTIGQLLTRFNFQDLPPSLRDAVLVTEKLGLQFLWVDAICIVQDDEHEKAWEIAQMPLVYNQATVTIAASRASGIGEGFLAERPTLGQNSPQLVFELPYRFQDSEIGSVVLVPEVRESTEPLDRRAWALQERLLSSRILEYGTLQTRWTCQHAERDKDLTDGWKYIDVNNQERSDTLFVEAFQTVLAGLTDQESSGITIRKSQDPLTQWHQIVQIYTHRALSLPTDRLPAISGIAERYGKILGDDYVGGLWRSRLPQELLWASGPPLGSSPRKYQGPSWSWAAINGPVRFNSVRQLDEQFQVLDCQVLLSMKDAKFGAVRSGYLKLKGRIRPAEWIYDSKASRFKGWEGLRSSGTTGVDEIIAASAMADSEENELSNNAVGFVPVFLLLVSGGGLEDGRHGLLLRLLPNGEYSRLGVFRFDKVNLPCRIEESEGSQSKRFQEQFRWLCEGEPQEITIV